MNKSHLLASALLYSVLSVSQPAQAEPQGGEVRAGSATIQQTLGTTTVQQLTDRAIIDWQRFNVAPNELVKFVQPNEMAVILNRVTGGDPSRILGKLQANGQLFLVNPNGILFGPQSQVDVGSLVVTTLTISNEDFLNGNYTFKHDSNFDLASVVNQGQIHVSDEGYVILTAPLVSNEGLIVANLGKVHLGAANEFTMNLDGRNLVSYQLGQAQSESGTVVLTPDAVSEMLASVVTNELSPAVQMVEQNGEVHLMGGGGTLVQTGTVQAEGGSIVVNSDQSTVLTGALSAGSGFIETSSRNEVHISGDVELSQGGEWYIDPANITIDAAFASSISSTLSGGGNVTVDAAAAPGTEDGNITQDVGADIVKSGGGDATLTLQAGPTGDIVLNGDITSSSGELQVELFAGDSVFVNAGADITTLGGDFFSDGTGNFTSADGAVINTGTGTISVTAGGDISVGSLQAASGGIVLGAGGAINEAGSDAGNDIASQASILEAAGGIGTTGAVELSVTDALTLSATGPGAGIAVDANGFPDLITINAAGNVDTGDLSFLGGVLDGQAPGELVFTAAGNIEVREVTANSITLTATGWIRSENVEGDPDLIATNLTLNSLFGGIGQDGLPLEIEAETLNVTSAAGTRVEIRQGVGTLNIHGDLSIENVAIGANTNSVFYLHTEDVGNLLVDNITANNVILVSTFGSIAELGSDPEADITAVTSLDVGAQSGLGTAGNALEVNGSAGVSAANYLSVGQTGVLNVRDTAGGLHLEIASTQNGDLTLAAVGGNLDVNFVSAADITAPHTIFLSTVTSGDVVMGIVDANDGDITIASAGKIQTDFVITPFNLQAEDVILTSVTGIGTGPAFGAQINIDSATVSATVTGTGPIFLVGTGSSYATMDVLQAVTNNGNIYLESFEGDLNAQFVNAGNLGATLKTSSFGGPYNVLADDVRGGTVTITSIGGIYDPGADFNQDIISTGAVTMTAVGEIGTAAAPLSVTANSLTTTAGGETGLNINNAMNSVYITTTTGTDVTLTGFDELNFDGGELDGTLTSASVHFQTNFGDILLTELTGNEIRLTATAGSIYEFGSDLDADITGTSIRLTANTLIGGGPADRVELAATGAATLTTSAGSGTYLSLTNEFGNLDVTAGSTGAIAIGGSDFLSFELGELNGENEGTLKFTAAESIEVGLVEALDVDIRTTAGLIFSETDNGFADIEAGNLLTLHATTGIDVELTAVDVDAVNFGVGSILLDSLGTADVTMDADTANGSIFLVAQGDLNIGQVVAHGAGSDISVTANGLETRVNRLDAPDTVSVIGTSTDLIGTNIFTEVYADKLLILVDKNVSLQTEVANLEAVSDTGSIAIQENNALTVGGIGATDGVEAAGAVTLQVGGNLLIGETIASGGTVTLTTTAGGSTVGGGVDGNEVEAVSLAITTPGGVNLDTAVQNLEALSTAGSIRILNTGALTVGGIGALVGVDARGAGNDVELQATGSIVLAERVKAVDQTILSTSNGSILGDGTSAVDVESANLLNLTASTGIGGAGALEVNATTGTTANVTGVGGIALVDPLGGFVVLSAVTADGAISLTADGGILDARTVTAGGTGRNVTLTTTTSGNVLGGNVSATGDTVTVTAVGAIEESGSDTTADFTANQLTLSAGTGIGAAGAVEVAATTLTAAVSGNGSLNVEDRAGGMTVASATTTNGSINLGAVGGDLTLTNVVAAGTGADVTVTTTTSGNVLVNLLSAPDTLTVSSAGLIDEVTPTDISADFVAPTIHLDAVAGAGVANLLRLDTTTVNATVSGAGRIFLLDVSGGVTYNDLSTTSGEIRLNANNGNMDVVLASVGGTSTFSAVTNGSGNIRVGEVSAPNNQALLRSQGSIEEISADGGADVISKTARLEAVTGIGSLSALETETNTIVLLTVSQPGSASIVDLSGGLVVNSATTFNGSISLQTTGGLLNGKRVIAGGAGNVTLATITSGDIRFSEIRATANDLTMTSAGLIQETSQDPATDLFARNLTMSAVSGIGSSPATTLEADSDFLTASVSGAGGIFVNDRLGNVTLNLSTANGPINIGGVGTMSAPSVQAGGANDVTLTSAGKVLVGNIVSGGAVFVTGTNVNELTPDPGVDITAAGDSELVATDGTIGVVDALEVSITGATLGVSATRQSAGVSVRIDGVVSPTDALIKLNAPPGQVLLNGDVQ